MREFSRLLRRVLAGIACSLIAATGQEAAGQVATAQEEAILVLDASGSMWGQIDGEAKISTARRLVGDLLDALPAERRLGLVAYGHNRKGDCGDIEEIATLGTDRATIKTAIANLNPKGMTPLSASVKFAAEKLKYTENKATVILVSDGIETCNLDPCAVGSELEAAGVDFTAHVIGFDIKTETDRVQLQCLAENTGGRYLNASNADELSEALTETVVEAPTEEPTTRLTGVSLRATELAGGPLITTGLSWTVQQAGGGETLFEATDAGEAFAELPAGTYDIFVERPSDGLSGNASNIELRPGSSKTVTVPLALSFNASVSVTPESEAPASSEIIVAWEGPDRQSDYVTIVAKGAREGAYLDYEYTSEGNPLKLKMPNEPGDYEVRYMLGKPPRTLAQSPIKATATSARLDGPETVAAGESFDVSWDGPNYKRDWVTIVKPDASEGAYTNYWYTSRGDPAALTAPLEPGAYELRYVSDRKVIARRPIDVTGVAASITGPETAMAGARHQVSWTGPNAKGDWITVAKPSDDDRRYTDYVYVEKGAPQALRMPLEPGDYELRYVQAGRKVIARQPVVITAAEVSLDAPDMAKAGSMASVSWTGPGEKGDWITIVKPSEDERRYTDYEYTREGNPLELQVPVEPGAYEYRYVLDGRKVVFRKPLEVSDVDASVTGPANVATGADFSVTVTGPAYPRDFVTIVKPGERDNRYTSYKYAQDGLSPTLVAPNEPGEYELRYVLRGQRVIARRPITVSAAQ